jgi:PAS domain S-box-containing protein
MLEGVMITDVEMKILAVNATFTRVTGYSADDVIGQTPRILKSAEHKPIFYTKMWTALAKNGYWQGEITNRRQIRSNRAEKHGIPASNSCVFVTAP